MYVSITPFGFSGLVQVKVANLVDTNLASNALGGEDRLFLESFGFSAAENGLIESVLIFVELFELGKVSVHKSKIKTQKTKINKQTTTKTTKEKKYVSSLICIRKMCTYQIISITIYFTVKKMLNV